MTRLAIGFTLLLAFILGVSLLTNDSTTPVETQLPAGRREVIFWHFWGGADRKIVEDIVRQFNNSQSEHFVRAIAMPGNNLDLKLFLSVTGGHPPDVVNQDDPIIADWAHRGALTPLDELATAEEMQQLQQWLFPAARKLGTFRNRMYGLCNGLDIRALYYNKTWLAEFDLQPPQTAEELKVLATTITPPGSVTSDLKHFGYLPDPRRLWAWGFVFGGRFYDPQRQLITCNRRPIVDALNWMTSFSRSYGKQTVMSFRQGDQSLPGKTFPLLPIGRNEVYGRYAVIMDGQWRVRDIEAWLTRRKQQGGPAVEFGVAPLPPPASGGRSRAGWVNGNFFLVPRNCRNPEGAWRFMKFWSGFGNEARAAQIATAGGWIPVSPQIVQQTEMQSYLKAHPLFATFVDLAASANQFPVPIIPGAQRINRELKAIGTQAITSSQTPKQLLDATQQSLQSHIRRIKGDED